MILPVWCRFPPTPILCDPMPVPADTATLQKLNVPTPGDGELVSIADDLLWFRFHLPFRLNHINLFALDTDQGWMLIDCGINSDDIGAQWDVILPQLEARKPVAGIIVTHHHADHIGYAGALAARTGAPIHIGDVEHSMARWALSQSEDSFAAVAAATYANFGLPEALVTRTTSVGNYYRKLVGDFPEARIITPDTVIETVSGNWKVRFDAGHAPGHLGLYDEARRLYIAVDFLLGRISPNISVSLRDPDRDVLAQYYEYLASVANLGADWQVICGHDWHYHDGAARAAQLVAHHDKRLDELRVIGTPQTTSDAMNTLFRMELTDHEIFFASCEARAHLNHLVSRGDLVRDMQDGVAVFSPA